MDDSEVCCGAVTSTLNSRTVFVGGIDLCSTGEVELGYVGVGTVCGVE